MAAQSVVIACSSTPTTLAGAFSGGTVHGYIRVVLKSIAGIAYLGDSGVTTAGYPFSTADAPVNLSILTGETLWAATSSGGTASVVVLRMGETT